jgi:hypothetical protein
MLAIDLCCGRGTWTDGFLAMGYDVIGFDVIRQPEYRGRLVLQDVATIDGQRLHQAAVIVASPPCEEFSRWQMPWTRAKHPPVPSLALVEACQRIAREAGVPLILENVRAAQRWLGRAVAHLGPVYLWGDGVPALLPMSWTKRDKERHSGTDRLGRASIPPELAAWVAECYAR